MRRLALAFVLVSLATGCSTFTPGRYSINADTSVALRSSGITGVGIGAITGPAQFSEACRGAGPVVMPDGMTVGSYIQKALTDEMKLAGLYAAQAPRVTLSGVVEKAEFSSAWSGSSWTLAMTLSSTNGRTLHVADRYDFKGSYVAETACGNVANAFMPAVQNLIHKAVTAAEFKDLLL